MKSYGLLGMGMIASTIAGELLTLPFTPYDIVITIILCGIGFALIGFAIRGEEKEHRWTIPGRQTKPQPP